ncbi:unnamed protein product [Urochloa decumbens]|uniref:Uncharacterized protein n=1 Tax=Urochloa decumbens TaxID=240449 RepID=A0ABC9A1Q4_9POAL
MALRSLVVKLKDLPRRIPVSGAFAPKEIPWSSSCARLTDPAKYGSVEEMARAIGPLLEQNMKYKPYSPFIASGFVIRSISKLC